jgi:putative transposon-encoded protein
MMAAPVCGAVSEVMQTTVTVRAEEKSGKCGEDLTWTLDEDGTLTISGTGEMNPYPSLSPFSLNEDIKKVVIESGVTSIGRGAFNDCPNLTEITIPDSVTSIGAYAFQFCPKLKEIVIPDKVKSIEQGTFSDCESLSSVVLPDGLESIRKNAFISCKSLTDVTIPESVTSIGDSAFYSCPKLNTVTIRNPKCEIYDYQSTFCSNNDGGSYTFTGTICGYPGSTAQAYAEKYGRTFKALDGAPESTAPAETLTLGDLNGDTTVDIMDCIMLNKNLIGVAELTDAQRKAADINKDGSVSADDSLNLLKTILGIPL